MLSYRINKWSQIFILWRKIALPRFSIFFFWFEVHKKFGMIPIYQLTPKPPYSNIIPTQSASSRPVVHYPDTRVQGGLRQEGGFLSTKGGTAQIFMSLGRRYGIIPACCSSIQIWGFLREDKIATPTKEWLKRPYFNSSVEKYLRSYVNLRFWTMWSQLMTNP